MAGTHGLVVSNDRIEVNDKWRIMTYFEDKIM
jgi:hypothetical protein